MVWALHSELHNRSQACLLALTLAGNMPYVVELFRNPVFDLADLYPLTTYLDLGITATDICEGSILVLPYKIASAVHATTGLQTQLWVCSKRWVCDERSKRPFSIL